MFLVDPVYELQPYFNRGVSKHVCSGVTPVLDCVSSFLRNTFQKLYIHLHVFKKRHLITTHRLKTIKTIGVNENEKLSA